MKFLKKTDWAREKVEAFYLYEFKNLPHASGKQQALAPRDRIVPDDHKPGEPAKLNLEDAERLRIEREKKAAEWNRGAGYGSGKRFNEQRAKHSNQRDHKAPRKTTRETRSSASSDETGKVDPWANWKSKS